jgi:hypothetical protein
VGAAAFTEAVTHHAEGKQRKDERQENHKKEASKPERRWLFFFKAGRIRISLHQTCLPFAYFLHHPKCRKMDPILGQKTRK